jgi:hypothetical protein
VGRRRCGFRAELYALPLDGEYRDKRTFAPSAPIVSAVFPGPPETPAEFIFE